MTNIDERLLSYFNDAFLTAMKKDSISRYFVHELVPNGEAYERYVLQYLADIVAASAAAYGIDVKNAPALIPGEESFKAFHAKQEISLSPKDLAYYNLNFSDAANLSEVLSESVNRTVSDVFLQGQDPNTATSPQGLATQYNFLLDPGTSNGTVARPLMAYAANKTGVWGTWSNVNTDISGVVGGLLALGYGNNGLIGFYPRIASGKMIRVSSEYQNMSILQMFANSGVLLFPAADEYFYTAAGAAPTADLFDIVVCDPTQIIFKDFIAERVKSTTIGYNTIVTGEYAGVPIFKPLLKNVSGTLKVYKAVGRIQAIAFS